MKLYNSPMSPNALRARSVAFELRLDPEIMDVNIGSGENRTAEYLKLNPNGKVPTLVDGDVVIWESRAINAYLASKKPERDLCPTDPVRRAMVDQWSYWQAIHLGPAMQKINFERVQKAAFGRGAADESSIAGELKTVADLLPILDAALAGKEWIAGSLSIADFALATTFTFRRLARIGVEQFANVDTWISRMEARPAWQQATATLYSGMKARGVDAP